MFKKRSDKTLKYFFPFQGKISGTKRIKKNIYQKKNTKLSLFKA